MTESESALATAKTRRAEASTALQVAAVSTSADLLDVDVCKAHVAAVEQARAAAITAAKPDAAMKADSALLTARITLEIAAARAKASTKKTRDGRRRRYRCESRRQASRAGGD
jgi:hypothetical protein